MKSNEEELQTLAVDTRLAGKTVLVTGSTSGIGEAIARVLAASGAEVVVNGRDAGRAEAVVRSITAAGGHAHAVVGDLGGTASEVRRIAAAAEDALGGHVDVVVNNAGIYPVGPTADLADADLDAVLAVNVRAPHVLVGALAPAMVERGGGSIVNIGSWMARVGVPFGAAYTASKAALEQMTRTWSAEFGPSGVGVTTVSPGATSTPGNAESADVLAAMTAGTVAGRPVRPVDVAFAVRWLVSDEAAFVHGSTVDVDGGIAAVRLG
ncbi:short-chain dehydrogenase [Frigoribacterium sp. Leaf164]|jgi:NAD(P)-dependent dehydrogenase (short-subunit alcohol dehydrogenase family)|uniref:SDR family NAD(P)-dependent oxidoreductase n=1 Tax=Frigoribacterium sp. Leaf164 TaxID=1736282 RepID=UPI0006F1EBB4|nr:SDR family oxidoreductase [Frigoribacterium sp. Leaf164]KQR44405.1 short-chain dehydrogenase [Frigoribacterium sp. Leaf164]